MSFLFIQIRRGRQQKPQIGSIWEGESWFKRGKDDGPSQSALWR